MQKQEEAWFLATYAPPEDNRLRLFRLLEEHNITVWTPEYQAVKQYPGRRVIRQRALFTGYFFIMLNLNRTPTDFIYQQPGFGGFVRQGNQLLPVLRTWSGSFSAAFRSALTRRPLLHDFRSSHENNVPD